MAFEIISPNMMLPVPSAGNTSGPQYALDVNNCLTIIDQHDHSPGHGVSITPAGLYINQELSMVGNDLTQTRSVRFLSNPSPIGGGNDLNCAYVSGVDLYYTDGDGNIIQITQGGGIAGSPGSIANLVSPASASYVALSAKFVFQSDANTPADIDGASYILRNLIANSKALTLSPPNSMAADYSIVLPSLPSVTSFVTMDNSGNMSTALPQTKVIQANANSAYNLSIVRGTTNGVGTSTGEGFVLNRVGVGTYSVVFTTIFADVPAVSVTGWGPGGAVRIATVDSFVNPPTGTSFTYLIYDSTFTLVDSASSFIAIARKA